MFYLTTHSTDYIWCRMVKDHLVKEIACSQYMGYSFQLAARVFIYMAIPDMIAYTTAFCTPVMEHLMEREIAQ